MLFRSEGNGRLRRREMTIVVRGRGSAAHARQAQFWAPVLAPMNDAWRGDAWRGDAWRGDAWRGDERRGDEWQRRDRNTARRSLTLVDQSAPEDAGFELTEVAS